MTGPATTSPQPPATADTAASLRLAEPADAVIAAADDAVARFRTASHSPETLRAYRSAWTDFLAWCTAAKLDPLPAEPSTVARYLGAAAEDDGLSRATLDSRRAAIAWHHSDADLPDPTTDAGVRRVLTGVAVVRTEEGEEVSQAAAAVLSVVQAMTSTAHDVATTWIQQVAARRDIALITLMFAAALRRSEAVKLTLADLSVITDQPGADGDELDELLRVRLRGSKTSRTKVEHLYLRRGTTDALWCPWCAVQRWIVVVTAYDNAVDDEQQRQQAAGIVDVQAVTDAASIAVQRLLRRDRSDPHEHRCAGPWPAARRSAVPLFRPLTHGGLPRPTALTGRSVGRIFGARADAAGVEPMRGHSARAGAATEMFDRGASVEEVMALTRHRRMESALRYDRRRARRSADAQLGL